MDNLIVVTGYGQFYGHEVNASGEAVKLLPDELILGTKKYILRKLEVSVEYEDVDKKVEEIWNMKPFLVVHCGVHGATDKIKLEKCSFNEFCLQDFKGKCLADPIISLNNSGKCQRLETKLNVDKITNVLNESYRPMFESSCDVGKYLCGYIYLKSLDIDPQRSLFVHVPCINKPFSTHETANGI
ncbi:CLUMA_CG014097, isoform A, partial [Clunio marinus]